jgi:hypothetical protein
MYAHLKQPPVESAIKTDVRSTIENNNPVSQIMIYHLQNQTQLISSESVTDR